MIKKLGGLIAIAGLLLLATTATSSDMNLIGIKQIIIQGALSLAMIVAGAKMGGAMDEVQE